MMSVKLNKGKTSTRIQGRDIGIEEGAGKEIVGRRTANASRDVWRYKA